MGYKCIGCDRDIGWDGEGTLSLTCVCGSHIFCDGESIALPASLVLALYRKAVIPHLNYLVGESDHTSPMKEDLITELRKKGAILMEECERCQKNGTLERKREREKAHAVKEAEMIIRGEGGTHNGTT